MIKENNYWIEFCNQINQFSKSGKNEKEFQNLIIDIFNKTFNWPLNSIKRDVKIKNKNYSNIADIVLEGKNYGIIIEVKNPSISIEENDRKRLVSCMKNYIIPDNGKRCEYGLLIGNKIEVFYLTKTNKIVRSKIINDYDVSSEPGKLLGYGLLYPQKNPVKKRIILRNLIIDSKYKKEYEFLCLKENKRKRIKVKSFTINEGRYKLRASGYKIVAGINDKN